MQPTTAASLPMSANRFPARPGRADMNGRKSGANGLRCRRSTYSPSCRSATLCEIVPFLTCPRKLAAREAIQISSRVGSSQQLKKPDAVGSGRPAGGGGAGCSAHWGGTGSLRERTGGWGFTKGEFCDGELFESLLDGRAIIPNGASESDVRNKPTIAQVY